MIKLSDYLNYLNSEVVQACKNADEKSIRVAKEYAANDILRCFPAPRYTMPSVKLSIPIKIARQNTRLKYNFKMNDDAFINDVNSKVRQINKEKNLDLKFINRRTLTNPKLAKIIESLEKNNDIFVKDIDDNLYKAGLFEYLAVTLKERKLPAPDDKGKSQSGIQEMGLILIDAFRKNHTLIDANLKDVFIDPDTSKETDKGKILLMLNVEMVEEGIRIRSAKDEDGNTVEEIVFE